MKKSFILSCIILLVSCNILFAQETIYLRNGSVIKGIAIEDKQNEKVKIRTSDESLLIYEMGDILNIVKEKCKFTETVYLKNGSVIHGCVSEWKPGVSLILQTRDGNSLKYSMEEVACIEKNNTTNYKISPSNGIIGKSISRGYRGFVDFSYHDNFNTYRGGEFSTIHGYQGNPYLFIGMGLGLCVDYFAGEYESYTLYNGWKYFWSEDIILSIPVYLNARIDIPFEYGGPFFDYKFGIDAFNVGLFTADFYEFTNAHSILSVGYRVKFRGKGGINFSLGWKYDMPINSWKYFHTNSINAGISFDF